jgi:hypothetical protein
LIKSNPGYQNFSAFVFYRLIIKKFLGKQNFGFDFRKTIKNLSMPSYTEQAGGWLLNLVRSKDTECSQYECEFFMNKYVPEKPEHKKRLAE